MNKRAWLKWLCALAMLMLLMTAAVCAANEIAVPTFSVEMGAGAQKKSNNVAVWTPTSSSPGHPFMYTIHLTLVVPNGKKIDENKLTITIPKSVVKLSNDNVGDTYALSVPEMSLANSMIGDASEDVYLCYDDSGADSIVLTNFKPLEGKTYSMDIELAYYTSRSTFEYEDFDFDKEGSSVTDADRYTAELVIDDTTIDEKAYQPAIRINTQAILDSTEKLLPSLYKEPVASWGLNDKSGDYWYLAWPVATVISGNTTQPYDFTLTDTIGQVVNENDVPVDGATMKVCAVKLAGRTNYITTDTDLFGPFFRETIVGRRVDTVITRVPASAVSGLKQWSVLNTALVNVHPFFDKDEAQNAASQKLYTYYKPEFFDPPGQFNAWKRADGAHRQYGGNIYALTDGSEIFTGFPGCTLRTGEYTNYTLQEYTENGAATFGGFDYAVWDYGEAYGLTRNHLTAQKQADGSYAENAFDNIYGQVPVKYVIEDKNVQVMPTSVKESEMDQYPLLNSTQFQFTTLQYNIVAYKAKFDADSQSFRRGIKLKTGLTEDKTDNNGNIIEQPFADTDILTFYYKTENTNPDNWDVKDAYTDDWQLYGTINLGSGEVTDIPNDKVDTTTQTVTLPENTIAYRVETENAYYTTAVGVVANLELKSAANLVFPEGHARAGQNMIQDAPGVWAEDIKIRNNMRGTLVPRVRENGVATEDWNWDGALHYIVKDDYDFSRISDRRGTLTKKAVAGRNDTLRRQYVVSWYAEQNETLTAGSTQTITQQSGTFFDLLPKGATLDERTVVVRAGGIILNRNYYTVTQQADYDEEHRTLVRIEIKEPGSSYSVSYDTVHAWDIMKEVGMYPHNDIAYETGNAMIGRGDDNQDEKRDYHGLRNLDPSVQKGEEKFLYADANFNINCLTAAFTGLSKRVRSVEDTVFSDKTSVLPEGDYIYRLRYGADSGADVKDIVFFDQLEKPYKMTNGETSYVREWWGKLTGVDLSNAALLNIDAKLYYTTTADFLEIQSLSTDNYKDVLNQMTPWAGGPFPTNVTAIAIDLSKSTEDKDNDGENDDYVLKSGNAVSLLAFMEAPELTTGFSDPKDPVTGEPVSPVPYPKTYNEVIVCGTRIMTDDAGNKTTRTILLPAGVTTVDYKVVGDVLVHKQSERNASFAIAGMTFRLTGTSDYGTAVDQMAVTDANGNLGFFGIERGSYTLQEYDTTPDWLLNTTEFAVTISKDGEVSYKKGDAAEIMLDDANPRIIVENTPRIHGDLLFFKRARELGENYPMEAIGGVRFRLSGTSDYGTEIEMFATSEATGAVRFDNIEKGRYDLEEIESSLPDDYAYIPLGEKLSVKLDENGVASIGDNAHVEKIGSTYSVYNERRYWPLKFTKAELTDNKTAIAHRLEGAKFSLEGTSDLGTKYTYTADTTWATSDANGIVDFGTLEKGTYKLREVVAPTRDGINYAEDPATHFVNISDTGVVTITGSYEFPDEPAPLTLANEIAVDDKLTVYKQWEDTTPNENRPEPELMIWTSADTPDGVGPTVTYIANGGTFRKEDGSSCGSKNVVRYKTDGVTVASGSPLNTHNYVTPSADSTNYNLSNGAMTFEGWYTDLNYTTEFIPGTTEVKTSMKVYAKWSYVQNFAYKVPTTASPLAGQVFIVPMTGYYELEVWGAMGGGPRGTGTDPARPGYGGYSSGVVYLQQGETLYVYVGGKGLYGNPSTGVAGGFNGGGSKGYIGFDSGTGGGMTHIATVDNNAVPSPTINGAKDAPMWDSSYTLIVAGGGGGTDNDDAHTNTRGYYDKEYGTYDGTKITQNEPNAGGGGDGGGIYGEDAYVNGWLSSNIITMKDTWNSAYEGRPTGGGPDASCNNWTSSTGRQGLGQCIVITEVYSHNDIGSQQASDTGTGGGGWYGGASSLNCNGGGGGGSGYVSPKLYDGFTGGYKDGIPELIEKDGQSVDALKNDGITRRNSNENASYNGYPYNGFARITYLPDFIPTSGGEQ